MLTYILKYVSNEWLYFEVLKENRKYTSAKKVSVIIKNFLNLNFCERLLSQRRFPSLARQQRRIDSFFKKRKIFNNLFTTFLFCLKKLTQEANCRTCLTRHSLKVASSLRYVRMTHRNQKLTFNDRYQRPVLNQGNAKVRHQMF